MTMPTARLAEIELPDFGMPGAMPQIPAAMYAERLEHLRVRMDERGYDRLVVYADREHSANLSFLTGFDPRFEEAVFIVGPAGAPAILVGNEGWGTAGPAPHPKRRRRRRLRRRAGPTRGSGRAAEWGRSAGRRMRGARRSSCPRSSWTSCAR